MSFEPAFMSGGAKRQGHAPGVAWCHILYLDTLLALAYIFRESGMDFLALAQVRCYKVRTYFYY